MKLQCAAPDCKTPATGFNRNDQLVCDLHFMWGWGKSEPRGILHYRGEADRLKKK